MIINIFKKENNRKWVKKYLNYKKNGFQCHIIIDRIQ